MNNNQTLLSTLNKKAVISFVLGFFCIIPLIGAILITLDNILFLEPLVLIGVLGWSLNLIVPLLAVIGLFLGTKGLKSEKKKLAILGIIFSIIGLIVSLIYFLSFFITVGFPPQRAYDTRIIANMIQIQRKKAQIIFEKEKSYQNLNCDYDEEMKIFCDDIKRITGEELTIHSSENEYCAYIKLTKGGYFCIDNTGITTQTTLNLGKENYCDGATFSCTGEKAEEPNIKVLSPNGGEKWVEGENYDITWESLKVEEVAISVAVGGKDKGHVVFATDATVGKYSWEIPIGFITGFGVSKSDAVRIRIYNTKDPNIFDENDNYFTITGPPLTHKDFSYPYPVSWRETYDIYYVDFALTGVSLGERTAPFTLFKSTGGFYNPGAEIYALTLYLKIKVVRSDEVGVCLTPNLRLELSEEGDFMAPNNNRFNADCLRGNTTYSNQEVIFVVSDTKKEFTLTTGGQSNIFFTVTVLEDGTLKVEKAYTEEKG